jgi:hypothetical protein
MLIKECGYRRDTVVNIYYYYYISAGPGAMPSGPDLYHILCFNSLPTGDANRYIAVVNITIIIVRLSALPAGSPRPGPGARLKKKKHSFFWPGHPHPKNAPPCRIYIYLSINFPPSFLLSFFLDENNGGVGAKKFYEKNF